MNYEIPGFIVQTCSFSVLNNNFKELMINAIQARNQGSKPVSGFHVGAAIRVEGENNDRIYSGSNVVDTICAEEHAVNCALQEQTNDTITITEIAICGALSAENLDFNSIVDLEEVFPDTRDSINSIMSTFVTPCGKCREKLIKHTNLNTKLAIMNPNGLIVITPFQPFLPFPISKIGQQNFLFPSRHGLNA